MHLASGTSRSSPSSLLPGNLRIGWTADSGFSQSLLDRLSENSQLLIVDARAAAEQIWFNTEISWFEHVVHWCLFYKSNCSLNHVYFKYFRLFFFFFFKNLFPATKTLGVDAISTSESGWRTGACQLSSGWSAGFGVLQISPSNH